MSIVPWGCCQCCCWGPRWHLCCRPAAETPLAPGWHRCLTEGSARMGAVFAVLGAVADAACLHVRPPGNPGCHTADLDRRRGRLCRVPVLHTHGLPAPVPACNIRRNMLCSWEDQCWQAMPPVCTCIQDATNAYCIRLPQQEPYAKTERQLHARGARFHPWASAAGWLVLSILRRVTIDRCGNTRPITRV